MTADSFRLRVQKAITASLELNVEGVEYNYTLADHVFRGRAAFGPNDGEYLVSVLEPPVTPENIRMPEPVTSGPLLWSLLIQGFAPNDIANPSDPAHQMMADVRKRFAIEKSRIVTGAPNDSDRYRNPFGLGQFRNGVNSERQKNYIDSIVFIGTGIVRPPDDGISDKAYFWLPLTLKLVEDIENPFV